MLARAGLLDEKHLQQCYDRLKYIYEQSQCYASIKALKFGGMPYEDAHASMHLFTKEVMSELRKLGQDPLFDTEPAAPPKVTSRQAALLSLSGSRRESSLINERTASWIFQEMRKGE